jgi:4-amino-4-deoxy-L-arabinose transferase-like glycosyltransferase
MILSYLGALKTWVYNALFAMVRPGAISLRMPTVLCGAATIWLFFQLIDQTIGRRAAWIGALLLATDTSFVILEAIDYGPNAFHFLFKIAALLLLIRFHRTESRMALCGAFFLFGLGLWDKAIFVWALFGLVLGSVVFLKEIRRHLTMRNIGLACVSVTIGALPLLIYNISDPLATLSGNVRSAREPLTHKVEILKRTVDGSVLFGFLNASPLNTSIEPPAPGTLPPVTRSISEAMHHPTRNFVWFALALSLPFLFLRKSRKPVLFGWLVAIGTWLPMLPTAGTGTAAHHAILLWPFPFFAIAAALDRIGRIAWVAAIALMATNLAVTNEYIWQIERNGTEVRWTEAIFTLNQRLAKLKAPTIQVVDWGIIETINLLSQGETPVAAMDERLRNFDGVFVDHSRPYAIFPNRREILDAEAERAGYAEEIIDIIYDRNGRARFDVFRFRKIPL